MTGLVVYDEFRSQLAELKEHNASLVFDYASPKGAKEAKSHIYKLRQTNAALERARKEAKADYLEKGRLVDSEAKSIASELEQMIAVHERPLKEIEEREAARVARHEGDINGLKTLVSMFPAMTAAALSSHVERLQVPGNEQAHEEYLAAYEQARSEALNAALSALDQRIKYEAEQEELSRLRAESERRAREDHDRKVAAEAAERAEKAAEQRAQAERDAAARREREAQLALEAAQRAKEQAEQRAKDAEKAAAEKAVRDAEEAKRKAAAELAAREADKNHKAKINNAAVAALADGGLTEEQARLVVTLVAKKQVPNMSIAY